MIAAYEATRKKLGLADRDDAITEVVAKKIIELGQRGVRDLKEISALAMSEMGL